jgi:F0F1-type ATP synthase assembly protein I
MRRLIAACAFVAWLYLLARIGEATGWGGWLWGLVVLLMIGFGWGVMDAINERQHLEPAATDTNAYVDPNPDEHSRDFRYL